MSDNPTAFPVSTIDGFTYEGMTLRDWFAGGVLNALIAFPGTVGDKVEKRPAGLVPLAYEYADAMLAFRAKTGGEG